MVKGGIRVSQSKIKTYRKCHYAYYLRYVETLRRKQIKRPLQFGKIVHNMLEADANGDDPFEVLNNISLKGQKLFTAEKDMYEEIINDIRIIMRAYFDYYRNDPLIYYRRKGKSAEHELTIEIEDGITLIIIVDAIVRTPNKLRWVKENKTFSRRWNEDDRWRDLQSCIYIKALQLSGFPTVNGMCWDYIYSKTPIRPSMLKSGQLSKKRIDSLPEMVLSTIKKHKLDIKDYQSLLKSTEANLKNYFYRVFTPVHQHIVDSIWSDFITTAIEIRDTHGTKKEKNIDRHCSWCDYEPLCRAELQDLDTDLIKRRLYEKEEDPKKNQTKSRNKRSK